MEDKENRESLYNKMIEEENGLLIEENEILRTKLMNISNYLEGKSNRISQELMNFERINVDYFVGQRSVVGEIRKLI